MKIIFGLCVTICIATLARGAVISPIDQGIAALMINNNVDWSLTIEAPGDSLSNRLRFNLTNYECGNFPYSGDRQTQSSNGSLTVSFATNPVFGITVSEISPYLPAVIGVDVPCAAKRNFIFQIINGTGNYPAVLDSVMVGNDTVDNGIFNNGFQLLEGAQSVETLSFRYLMPSSVNGNSYINVYALSTPIPSPGALALLCLGPLFIRKQR